MRVAAGARRRPRALRPDAGRGDGLAVGARALKPLTLRAVFEVSRALPEVPVLASGGVSDGIDAVECLLAGAWAVQVGTATLIDPGAPSTVAKGIASYLKEKNLASPGDIRAASPRARPRTTPSTGGRP